MCLNLCIQNHLCPNPPKHLHCQLEAKATHPKVQTRAKKAKFRIFLGVLVPYGSLVRSWTGRRQSWRCVGSPPLHHLPTNFAKSPLVSPFSSTPYVACTCCACTSCVPLVKYTMEVEKFRRCYVTGSRCRPALSRNLDNGLIL